MLQSSYSFQSDNSTFRLKESEMDEKKNQEANDFEKIF